MTLSRRGMVSTLGIAGATAAVPGRVFAVGEHHDDERDEPDEEPDPAAVSSAVRVAHFSPDAPNVDVSLDGEQILSDVAFGDVSDYLQVEPGPVTVTIAAAGDPETVVFEDELVIDEAFYTVAAIGELEAETFRPLVLVDASSALARLVHAAPDAPAVDVTVADGQLALFENVSFGEMTEYVAVPAGDYTLEVRPAGGLPDEMMSEDEPADGYEDEKPPHEDEKPPEEPPEEAVATFDVTLRAGTVATGVATGYLDPQAAGAEPERGLDLQVLIDGDVSAPGPNGG